MDSGNSGTDDKGEEFIAHRRDRLRFFRFLRFFELKAIDMTFCEGSGGQGAGIGERVSVSLEIAVCGRGRWDNRARVEIILCASVAKFLQDGSLYFSNS